jgi:hypothetical protein
MPNDIDRMDALEELNSRIRALLASDDGSIPSELREVLASLDWYVRQARPRHSAHTVRDAATYLPEVIDHATQVLVFVSGALVNNWIARADNAAAQAFLRRRKRGRAATPTQIRHVGRFSINLQWPAQIKASDDPVSERRGPDGWSVSWVKNGEKYTAEGDNDLANVTLFREKVDP